MKLCSFSHRRGGDSMERLGVIREGRVFAVAKPTGMLEVLKFGARALESLEPSGDGYGLADVRLHAPVPRPGKIVATIVNTKGMLGGEDIGLERPRLDMKAPSTVIGPGETVRAPQSGIRPEIELAAVIGRRLSVATPAQARESIMGYTILNDVTAPQDSKDDAYEAFRRDPGSGKIVKKTLRGPLFRSKNHDSFCPLGPWVVTEDEFGETGGRRMTTRFDGALVQDGSTSEYIFSPAHIASYVSGFLTLEPGDIVSCGSVGWTKEALGSLDPTEFLLPVRSGMLSLAIEGIGELANPVAVEGQVSVAQS